MRLRLLPLVAAVIGLGVATTSAQAACSDTQAQLTGGTVTIKLDRSFRKAVKGPSSLKFPVSSGCLTPDTGVGTISTRRSFTIKAGKHKVKVTKLQVAGNRLKAKVGSKTVTLANLSVSVKVSRTGLNTSLRRSAKLAAAGRKAIDKGLHSGALRKVKKLGSVSAKTTTNQAVLKTGTATLTPSPQFVQGLGAQGISIAPAAPATVGAAGFAFPITGGKIDTTTLTGTISSAGGLTATKGGQTLTLSNFVTDLGAKTLSGEASVLAGSKVPLADLDLTNATHAPYSVPGAIAGFQFGNIVVKISSVGSAGLQQFIGANVPAGTVIGTLSSVAGAR